MFNDADHPFTVVKDTRIAQTVFQYRPQCRLQLVDTIDATIRGNLGFGSRGLDTQDTVPPCARHRPAYRLLQKMLPLASALLVGLATPCSSEMPQWLDATVNVTE